MKNNFAINIIKLILSVILITTFTSCNSVNNTGYYQENNVQNTHISNYVSIKYRDTLVDIGNPLFEYKNMSRSSFLRGARYDVKNQYMIINLKGTNYHYCGLSNSIWKSFKQSSSFGKYYKNNIKGNFDCRYNGIVPKY